MIRKAFVMQVNPDAHAEYQRRHSPIWPELEAELKAHGAHNYSIFWMRNAICCLASLKLNPKRVGMRLHRPKFVSAGGNIWPM